MRNTKKTMLQAFGKLKYYKENSCVSPRSVDQELSESVENNKKLTEDFYSLENKKQEQNKKGSAKIEETVPKNPGVRLKKVHDAFREKFEKGTLNMLVFLKILIIL